MRVAVIGGTGLVGRHTTKALRHAGHDAVVVARSTGTDVTTGADLDIALAGVQAVIDVTNTAAADAASARKFFATTTGHLLAAEQQAGVTHHVVLSIVGVDRVEGNAHYAGKRLQEEIALAGPIPATIVRATCTEAPGGPADEPCGGACTEPVMMEVLAGARDDRRKQDLRCLLD